MLEILENARIFFWFSHLLTKQYLSLNWRRDRKTLLKQFASQFFLVFNEGLGDFYFTFIYFMYDV